MTVAAPVPSPHGRVLHETGGIAVSDRPVVLVGFMGAGKSTIGRLLARRLGLPFFDTDAVIEQALGRPVRTIFADDGEAHFRELEHRTVAALVGGERAVIALGGGAVQDERTQALLAATDVVYLRVDYAVALERVGGDRGRPVLQRADLGLVYASRIPAYERVAAITVDTGRRRPEPAVDDILEALLSPRLAH